MTLSKSRSGAFLLLSLIPSGLLFLVAAVFLPGADTPVAGAADVFWVLMIAGNSVYWPSALVAGVVLLILGSREKSREYSDALAYAQRHGWHPITREMWRNRKRNGAQFAVNKAVGKASYILMIEFDDETTMVDEFSSRLWALEFGDWLGEELVDARASTDATVVAEKRTEWEQSRGMVVYRPEPLPATMGSGARRAEAAASPRASNTHEDAWSQVGYSKSKITAGLLALLLGGVGAHKFYLGHPGLGILWILLSMTFVGAIFWTGPASFAEAIIYFTRTDEDFHQRYVVQRRALF